LYRLRTDRLAPVNTIDYVLAHTRFMGASTVAELDDILSRFTDVQWGHVRTTHGIPIEVLTWKMTLGRGRIWPNSLIVIAKGGHSCCLCGSRVSCYQVISLTRCILIRISVTPSDMGDAWLLLLFCRSAILLCSYEIYGYV
jgi:hypothetical protein